MDRHIILLGAGASMDAGIPAAYPMTNKMIQRLSEYPYSRREANVLTYVVGGLLFNYGKQGVNPISSGVNIEDAFNAIHLISERDKSEAAPFIEAWHYFISELDKKYVYYSKTNLKKMIYEYIIKEIKAAITANHYLGSHLGNIDKAVAKLVDEKLKAAQGKGSFYLRDEVGKGVEAILKASTSEWARKMQNPSSLHNDDISREIGKLIDSTREKSGEGAIFSRTNDLMIALLKDLVYINDTSKVDYISPIFRVLDSQPSLTVATLNYDNVIELAGDVYGKQVNTGIGQWSHTGEIEISALGVNLLKIHGSITWSTNNGRRNGRQTALPTYQISEIQADKISEADFYPAVIFGGKNKLKADGPFLDLLRAFNYELKKCDILTVIGYSFRDEHINVYITRWLNGNDKRRIRIVNGPSFITDINNGMLPDYATYLLQIVQSGRVEIIPLYARDGIAQLFGEQLTPVHQEDIEISSTAFEKAFKKEKLASDYIVVSEANAHHEASDAPD